MGATGSPADQVARFVSTMSGAFGAASSVTVRPKAAGRARIARSAAATPADPRTSAPFAGRSRARVHVMRSGRLLLVLDRRRPREDVHLHVPRLGDLAD